MLIVSDVLTCDELFLDYQCRKNRERKQKSCSWFVSKQLSTVLSSLVFVNPSALELVD